MQKTKKLYDQFPRKSGNRQTNGHGSIYTNNLQSRWVQKTYSIVVIPATILHAACECPTFLEPSSQLYKTNVKKSVTNGLTDSRSELTKKFI